MSIDIVYKKFRTINTFGRDIYNSKITLKEPDEDQSSLLVKIMDFQKKVRLQNPEKKQEKKISALFERREEFLMLLKAKYFRLKLKVQVFQTRSLTFLISKY